ncbi:MAG: formate dehydrogenase accessory protein FdhE [Syntrophobacteraceae bacterium]
MMQESLAEEAAEKVAAALRKTADENEHVKDVLKAFGGILIEQARWAASLELPDGGEAAVDAAGFEKGIPASSREELIRLGGLWKEAARRLIPALEAGFPEVREKFRRIAEVLEGGSLDPDLFFGAAFGGRDGDARAMAERVGVEAELLGFVLTQLAKPVAEKRAAKISLAAAGLSWDRGYCPVCGSLPDLSLLREKEGRRWLRCSFCAALWRFQRLQCPFCGSVEAGDAELFYVEGRETERVEACRGCGRYITEWDVRGMAGEAVLEVAPFRLLHLDVMARKKGFQSAIAGNWAGLSGGDPPAGIVNRPV